MKPLSDALKIVTQEDIELAKKQQVRSVEPSVGEEEDPAKLMDLLGDIDGLKHEIHERMRRIEAVKQAKFVLQEDAERTEALNRRLAEIGKAMSVAQVGSLTGENERESAELLRMQARDGAATEGNDSTSYSAPRIVAEGLALSWSRGEANLDSGGDADRDSMTQLPELFAQDAGSAAFALQRMEETEQSRMEAWNKADESMQEARRLLDEANAHWSGAAAREEKAAAEFRSAEEVLAAAYQSAQARLEEAEQSRAQAWAQTLEAVQEAKRQLEEANSQFKRAATREEQAAVEFSSAEGALSSAYQSASERLEEAERSWKNADLATQEARRVLEQSTSELAQARKKEDSIAANLQSVRQEFSAVYESASQRLHEAERFWQRGDESAREAQQLVDQSTAELLKARHAEETAAADLLSSRQELTTAYQFAAVAAQRRLDAVESFQKAARWTVFSAALSWIAMVWMGWFVFHTKVPIWGPGAVSLIILLVAMAINKRGTHEA